jgi:catechol 2,3-dioxygenase-like lactoylglutathione lyase family enzyme
LKQAAAAPRFESTEAIMAELNHLIVWSKDKHASAKFLADMLGVPAGPEWVPFVPVKTGNGVTLDFIDGESTVRMQHYAFLVTDAEFDAAFARIKKAGLTYWADPHKGQPGKINQHWGGRGVYFEDPNGHLLELITKPYGDLAEI